MFLSPCIDSDGGPDSIRDMRTRVACALLWFVAACAHGITDSSAAAQSTIVLTQTANADAGCVDASPDPAVAKSGQPFNFQNNTSIDLTIYNVFGNAPLTTVGAGQSSASLVLNTPVTSLTYYTGRSGSQNLPCGSVHTITVTTT
jgi:hypothetical protein